MPRFLFNYTLKSEQHERRTEKDSSYLKKLSTYMILTVLVVPVLVCMLIAWKHVVSFENDRIAEELDRYKSNVPGSLSLLNPNIAALYSGIVDNPMNEFVAVMITKSQEYFIRIVIQIFFIIGMF
jgi:hypothetical protein